MISLPRSVVLELTYKCNHQCKFCSCPWYAPNGRYPCGQELNLEQWKQAIDKLYNLGVETFSISGGECLLKDCLADILIYIKEQSWKRGKPNGIVLISNGLLMNTDYLNLFKYCNVHLSMSLPGFESFKEHTGVDNAEGVLRWFQVAQRMGMDTTVNVTVTRKNFHELFETLSVGLLNGASSVLINRFLPGGRGLAYQDELALTNEELNGMLDTTEEVLTLSNRYGQTGTEIPLCAIMAPKKYKRISFGTKCAAAKDFFVIDPAGQIRTCNHSPIVVGSIFDDDIISDIAYWETFANSNYHPSACQTCKSINMCDCGCREVANILNGSPCAVDLSAYKDLNDKRTQELWRNKRYADRVAQSHNYTNLRPIISFVHELVPSIADDAEENKKFVSKIQEDLFTRGIIPFKVEGYNDIHKIDELPFSDVKRLLWYIWLSLGEAY